MSKNDEIYWRSPAILMVWRESTREWEEWAFKTVFDAEIALSEIAGLQVAGEKNALDIQKAILRPARGAHIN